MSVCECACVEAFCRSAWAVAWWITVAVASLTAVLPTPNRGIDHVTRTQTQTRNRCVRIWMLFIQALKGSWVRRRTLCPLFMLLFLYIQEAASSFTQAPLNVPCLHSEAFYCEREEAQMMSSGLACQTNKAQTLISDTSLPKAAMFSVYSLFFHMQRNVSVIHEPQTSIRWIISDFRHWFV